MNFNFKFIKKIEVQILFHTSLTNLHSYSNISNMSVFSVCIPRIFHNIPNKKIVSTFEILKLGKVKNMDIVWKTGRDGSSFKMAFIHFSEWNMCNSAARNFRDQVEDPRVDAKLVYDDPWYWLVLPNNSTTIINSYKNGSIGTTYSMPTSLNDVSEMINERLANLEDELNCVYEELYQREYIPVKYRSECQWNQDIETGSIDDTYLGNMSPMTIDELDCSSSSVATYDNTPIDVDELHKPPKYTKVYPEDDSLFTYSQDTFEEEELLFDAKTNYPIKIVIDNSELALYEHKTWMTANYCGNN